MTATPRAVSAPAPRPIARLLRLGIPGALAGFACVAGAQDAATADQSAVTLNRTGGVLTSVDFTLDGKSGTITLCK